MCPHISLHANLCVGNTIGLGVSLDLNDEEITGELPELIAGYVKTAIQADDGRLAKSILRARSRLHFISNI